MDRKLTFERLYNLGDFRSVKIGERLFGSKRIHNEVSGIPEELWLDPEFINKLRYLQMVQTDSAYFRYVEDFVKKFHIGKGLDDVPEIINVIDELELNIVNELKNILENNGDNE